MLIRKAIVFVATALISHTQAKQVTEDYATHMKKFDKLRINEKNFEKIHNIHMNWYTISIKALMGQMGKDLYSSLNKVEKRSLAKCLHKIDDNKDLMKSAKCLIQAREGLTERQNSAEIPEDESKSMKMGNYSQSSWVGGFKMVSGAPDGLKRLDSTKIVMPRKVDSFKPITRSPAKTIVNLFAKFMINKTDDAKRENQDPHKWTKMYNSLLEMKKNLAEKEKSPGARAYNFRMYDLVLDRKHPSMTPKESRSPAGLLRRALDIYGSLGKSGAGMDRRNVQVLSPRFAPLMPDKSEGAAAWLSPTFLSFYEENNSSSNIASIPSMLRLSGMNEQDRDAVLSTLMEASGTMDAVQEAVQLLDALNFSGVSEDVMNATMRMDNVYDKLASSFLPHQKRDMERKGYAFLDEHQLEKVYRDNVAVFPEEAIDFEQYKRLRPKDREEALWLAVERISRGESLEDFMVHLNSTTRRKKRSLETPSILAPTVLAPYAFTPILGLGVLGPVVLSPSLFSPLILNPAVLSPYVLSPGVGMPFILSPYLLSPYVLSPLVMAPFILNPYVLSPNVLNPYVLSPLILSPLVLCPDVLSPMLLGGNILSPSVASPAVLTESALMASVLSPSFLS